MKEYIKRVLNYIFRGIPTNHVQVNVSQIQYGGILKGRKILITGGNSGIGLAIAKKCIAEGAEILIIGRNEQKLKETANALGEKCRYLQFDVSQIEEIDETMKKAAKLAGGEFDALVLNAGISLHEENILKVTVEDYEKQFQTNLESAYFMAQAFLRDKTPKKEASLLFMSSERGHQCDDVPYGLTKAGINSLVRGLSRRFYRDGVRVNGIAPGITVSGMTNISENDNLYLERVAPGRVFLPEEMAEVACFLLSDAAKCISGEIIACDAGEYLSSYF